MRKHSILALVAFFSLTATMWSGEKNSSDYTQTAHVLGTASHQTPGGSTSTYNAQTGQWAHGRYSGSVSRETELRIGNFVYTVSKICKEVEVGKDYPARVDKKRISLLLGNNKSCDGRIEEQHEIQSPN